jgi:predicted nucleotide-binding protein
MNKEESIRRDRKCANLTNLLNQLAEQDDIIKGLIPRSAAWQGAPESVMVVLRNLFQEANDALSEKHISFNDSNDLDGLRAQISSLRSKTSQALTELGGKPPELQSPENRSSKNQTLPDPRRVFVVHGRNQITRQAMFTFLRAIGLDPIEWEEAIAMTSQGTPYTGHAIDVAFSNAHAAVILITGDDLACLKQEFISEHDDDNERKPTPQARPNVLFELGLAFGRKPDRTIIVEFGKTRPISDLIGRNVIRFSDTAEFKQKLAGRLRVAGCAVNTDSKLDWLTSKFDLPPSSAKLTTDVRFQQDRRILGAVDTRPEAKQTNTKDDPSPLLSNGGEEFIVKSPDNFLVRITRHEDKQVKGLILGVENRRLEMIGPYRLRILNAQSFDSDHQQYRDNAGFMAFSTSTTKPTGPSCTSENTWLVRKVSTNPHLQAGNRSPGNEMQWPNADGSLIQRWLLRIDVSTQTLPKPGEQAVPLSPVQLDLHLVWNPEKNEFFIDDAPGAST